jgi:DNA-binding NtrC family response regulator
MFRETSSLASFAKYPAAASGNSRSNVRRLPSNCRGLERFGLLYGACPEMHSLFEVIARLAATDAPVMILGESGSGKELVANTIHQLSDRVDRPFIAINCGAVPENLIESELFGHERGSFTGAARTHRGCFERASGGTLLLDEITEMPIDMQVRLLRVLETGRCCRVGGDLEIVTDVRILAASNRDLKQAVADGRLRDDLMYRLCVIPVTVPPLRDRRGDALLLAEMFLEQFNAEQDTSKAFTSSAHERIQNYSWPGNVRELRNAVQRAFVMSDDDIEVDFGDTVCACAERPIESSSARHAPTAAIAPVPGAGGLEVRVGMSLGDIEREVIAATLQTVNGSKTRAARMLGISLKTLYNRLHAYRQSDDTEPASGAIAA